MSGAQTARRPYSNDTRRSCFSDQTIRVAAALSIQMT
jgi:hypothetical protein